MAWCGETPRVPTGDEFQRKALLHKCLRTLDFQYDRKKDTTHKPVCVGHTASEQRRPLIVGQTSAPVPQTSRPAPRTPLPILPTETLLSRFPIHNPTTYG